MPTKKTSTTKKKAEDTAKKVKTTAKKAAETVWNTVEDVTEDAKNVAHKAGEKAKELLNEGKKSVEDLVDKVIDEDQINGYRDMIMSKFKTATGKDRVVFFVGAIVLIWALVSLADVVWGILLLLVAIVLMNMFFGRK